MFYATLSRHLAEMANGAWCCSDIKSTLITICSILLIIFPSTAHTNEVVGEPFISCAADAIYAKWKTKSTFTGHVNVRYAPNRYCYQVLVTNNQIELLVPHQDCQLTRRRSLHPLGVIIETSVLISFHAEYVTAGDRIYKMQCVHERAKDHSLMPGFVPTTLPSGYSRLLPTSSPKCEYNILNPDDDSLVERAAIGDSVRHEWSCKIPPEMDLCLMVANCYLLTSDSKHRLIDERGCSTDTSVLPELDYVDKLKVYQKVSMFGVAQKPYIRFQCQLSLIASKNGTCSKPMCTLHARNRKDTRSYFKDDDNPKILDAVSQELEIVEFGRFVERSSRRPKCNSATVVEKISSDEVVCVSRMSFGIVAISTVMVAICTLLVVIISLVQRFNIGG